MLTETPFTVTAAHRRQFLDEGYFITPVLFDADTLAGVGAEFMRLWREERAAARDASASTGGDLERLAFMHSLHLRSQTLADFCRHPALVSVAQQMVGDDVDQTWNQAIVKAPEKGKPFAWHQDARYLITEPLDPGITCWVAITRATVENGTLWVAPRMHKRGLLPHVWDAENREWCCQFDDSGKVPVQIEAGQALVFGRMVPHASGPNLTGEVRMAYQIGFAPPGIRVVATGELFGDQVPVLRNGEPVDPPTG